jgi:hypothetical protein
MMMMTMMIMSEEGNAISEGCHWNTEQWKQVRVAARTKEKLLSIKETAT